MPSSKANIICLLQILWEYSDADNILSMKDIKSKMNMLYDREIDRRTVYDCLNALNQLGYDISMFEENKKGYYLRERRQLLSKRKYHLFIRNTALTSNCIRRVVAVTLLVLTAWQFMMEVIILSAVGTAWKNHVIII